MPVSDATQRPSRETRLLLLIVAVSVAVLLLLARLRFPAADGLTAKPDPGPLAGLAGRGTFDDLADTLNTLLARVSPRLVPVELTPFPARAPGADARDHAGGDPPASPRITLGLRVRNGLVLIPVPDGWAPSRFADAEGPVAVVALDAAHGLVLARPPSASDDWTEANADTFAGLAYVGAFDATARGISIDPVFLGRVAPATEPSWPAPIWRLPDRGRVKPGVFVFSMDARLIGLATNDTISDALVPAAVLNAIVATLGGEAAHP